MANEKNELQEDFEELKEEYETLIEDARNEVTADGVNYVSMHLFNILLATVMMVVGGVSIYRTRSHKLKSGMKIAGWILLILGFITVVSHVIQLLF